MVINHLIKGKMESQKINYFLNIERCYSFRDRLKKGRVTGNGTLVVIRKEENLNVLSITTSLLNIYTYSESFPIETCNLIEMVFLTF